MHSVPVIAGVTKFSKTPSLDQEGIGAPHKGREGGLDEISLRSC